MQPAWMLWYPSKIYTLQQQKCIMCFFFFKIVFCVLQIYFYRKALVYWAKIAYKNVIHDTEQRFEENNSHIRYIGSISGDVKISIYCDHHVLPTLFYISLSWIESIFVFGSVVSFAIHVTTLDWAGAMIGVGVGDGGRVHQVCPKDVLWGSNPVTLRDMAIH